MNEKKIIEKERKEEEQRLDMIMEVRAAHHLLRCIHRALAMRAVRRDATAWSARKSDLGTDGRATHRPSLKNSEEPPTIRLSSRHAHSHHVRVAS